MLLLAYIIFAILVAIYQFGATYAWARNGYPMLDTTSEDVVDALFTAFVGLLIPPAALICTFTMFQPHKYGWWLWPTRAEREAHTKRCDDYWRKWPWGGRGL